MKRKTLQGDDESMVDTVSFFKKCGLSNEEVDAMLEVYKILGGLSPWVRSRKEVLFNIDLDTGEMVAGIDEAETSMGTPVGRRPIGEKAMTNAERQKRYRERKKGVTK